MGEASTLKEIEVAELRERTLVLERELKAALRENAILRERLQKYLRRLFGPKAEKIDPRQLQIAFDDLVEIAAAEQHEEPLPQAREAADDEEGTHAPARKKKGAHGRKPLPKDLPRMRVEHHPAQEQRTCPHCQAAKVPIGEEVTEELDWQPASMSVTEHVRIKYACKACQEGVVIGELPARPIEKGRPGTGLLAHVIVSKYADHLPLHRLEGIFARHGVEISRSTMCDWVGECAQLVQPIYAEIKRSVLTSAVIHADDTPILCQENAYGGGKRKTFLWVYVGEQGETVYDFTLSRAQEEPKAFLGEWKGYLQSDAYGGYNALYTSGNVMAVGCWAHVRRKYFDALTSDTERASRMLALIQLLYKVEAKAGGLDPPAIQKLRQEESRPILERIQAQVEQDARVALPQSALGEAVTYATNQWSSLTRYVEDGRLHIDNNAAERALRCVAVGRKNWLFAGSPAGGKRAAVLYSLIRTCKQQGVEPFAYLRDVLERISTHPASRIAELTPGGWMAARSVRA